MDWASPIFKGLAPYYILNHNNVQSWKGVHQFRH